MLMIQRSVVLILDIFFISKQLLKLMVARIKIINNI